MDADAPWCEVRHQLYLADDGFEAEIRPKANACVNGETSRAQRRALVWPLASYQSRYPDRREAMARAYLSGAYTMYQVANHFGVHYQTVSRAVRRFEKDTDGCERE